MLTGDTTRNNHLETVQRMSPAHRLQLSPSLDAFVTVPGTGHQADETVGFKRFGSTFWDMDRNAYLKYGLGVA